MKNAIKIQIENAALKVIKVDFAPYKQNENYQENENSFKKWVLALTEALDQNWTEGSRYNPKSAIEVLNFFQFSWGGSQRFGNQSKIYHGLILKHI